MQYSMSRNDILKFPVSSGENDWNSPVASARKNSLKTIALRSVCIQVDPESR